MGNGGDGEKEEERFEVASFPVSLFIKCGGRAWELGLI